jgi:hypothetical protein
VSRDVIDYIIWLISGESIYGSMDENEAERLKKVYMEQQAGCHEFRDTDGTLLICPQKVAVVALSESGDKVQAGFKQTNTPSSL